MEDFERTLVVIKPDAMKHKNVIVRRIIDAGFTILQSRIVRLTPEQASEFYRAKKIHSCYHAWIAALTEGPIQAMCVSKINAVSDLLWLIGPERYQDAIKKAPGSLRAMFADSRNELQNAVHGSEDTSSAHFEINFFFPSLLLEPIFNDQRLNNYLSAMVNPVLMQGLYTLAKERPKDPIMWFSNWLLSNNPYKPKISSSTSEP
ncbi:nucleoside diphosphate kinase homolog 5 [Ochlerotatus camptorhynchus]|uniref:nucleoside diphosphate kinase homolog 5 n=1 Tax=Ochlerotatus camptorhynchus TaxID=644619 RepID=UPI0031D02DE0